MLKHLKQEIQKCANPEKSKVLKRFFKTGNFENGKGDEFLGLTVPESRKIAGKFYNLPIHEIEHLLLSKMHEERLITLLILLHNFTKADEKGKKDIYNFYLRNSQHISNWDLVDLIADKIVGEYLKDKQKKILYKLAQSSSIWDRRIAIIATFQFFKRGQYEDTLKLSEILLRDEQDLIQKAVGWMLREVGKRCSIEAEETFLIKHYKKMPRTMLRYAIERFPKNKRQIYLKGSI